MNPAPHWLTRYLDGEHDAVWRELRELGSRVRDTPHAAEARAVCDEVARRCRRNIDVIVGRLSEQGYRFHDNDDDQAATRPITGPVADADALVAWLERTVGPVPMIVSSWVRIVGDVWLVGTHPAWPTSAAADPLVVELAGSRYLGQDIRSYYLEELEMWRVHPEDGTFQLPVSPDHLHKDNTSGGLPYGIELPDDGTDARLVTDGPIQFVSYLRNVFAAGGFPRWTGDPAQAVVQESLARELEPI